MAGFVVSTSIWINNPGQACICKIYQVLFRLSYRIFTKQPTMIREILTLIVEHIPTQYYIKFSKERTAFQFQPTLKNKAAPSFKIVVHGDQLEIPDNIDPELGEQAKGKVREILNNDLFDRF
jgi:hypothetical protein